MDFHLTRAFKTNICSKLLMQSVGYLLGFAALDGLIALSLIPQEQKKSSFFFFHTQTCLVYCVLFSALSSTVALKTLFLDHQTFSRFYG